MPFGALSTGSTSSMPREPSPSVSMLTKAWRTARKGATDARALRLTLTKPRMPPSAAESSGSSAYLESFALATSTSA